MRPLRCRLREFPTKSVIPTRLGAVEASFLGHGALDASIIAALRLRRTERGKNSLNQRRKGYILGILRLRAHHPLGIEFGAALRSGLRIV